MELRFSAIESIMKTDRQATVNVSAGFMSIIKILSFPDNMQMKTWLQKWSVF